MPDDRLAFWLVTYGPIFPNFFVFRIFNKLDERGCDTSGQSSACTTFGGDPLHRPSPPEPSLIRHLWERPLAWDASGTSAVSLVMGRRLDRRLSVGPSSV